MSAVWGYDELRRRAAQATRLALNAHVRDAARRYVRARDLPGLLGAVPADAEIVPALSREMRRQRALCRRGSWRACPIRYRLTLAAYAAERGFRTATVPTIQSEAW